MGLAAITRKGWMTNPRKQGKQNFVVSIVSVVVGTLFIWIFELDCSSDISELFCIQYLGIMSIFLLWGVVSLLGGELLYRINKKTPKK